MKKMVKRLLTGCLAVATMLTSIPMQNVRAAETTTYKFIGVEAGAEAQTFTYQGNLPGDPEHATLALDYAWNQATDLGYTYDSSGFFEDIALSVPMNTGTNYDEETDTYSFYFDNTSIIEQTSIHTSIVVDDGSSEGNAIGNLESIELDADVADTIREALGNEFFYDVTDAYTSGNPNGGTNVQTYVQEDETARDFFLRAGIHGGYSGIKFDAEDVAPRNKVNFKDMSGLDIYTYTIPEGSLNGTLADHIGAAISNLDGYNVATVYSDSMNQTEADKSMTLEQYWNANHTVNIYLAEMDTISVTFLSQDGADRYDATVDAADTTNINFYDVFETALNTSGDTPEGTYPDAVLYTDSACTVEYVANSSVALGGEEGARTLTLYIGTAQQGGGETPGPGGFTGEATFTVSVDNELSANGTFNGETLLVDAFKAMFPTHILPGAATFFVNETEVVSVADAVAANGGSTEGLAITTGFNTAQQVTAINVKDQRTGEVVSTFTVTNLYTQRVDDVIASISGLSGYDNTCVYNTTAATAPVEDTDLTNLYTYVTANSTDMFVTPVTAMGSVAIKFVGGTQEEPEQYLWSYTTVEGQPLEIERAFRVATEWKKEIPQLYTNSVFTQQADMNATWDGTTTEYTYYYPGSLEAENSITVKFYIVDAEDESIKTLVHESVQPNTAYVDNIYDYWDYYFVKDNRVYVEGRTGTDNNVKQYLSNTYRPLYQVLPPTKAKEANFYVSSADLYDKNSFNVYDVDTGAFVAKLNTRYSWSEIRPVLEESDLVNGYVLETIYASQERLTVLQQDIGLDDYYREYGHTNVYLESLPITYSINIYDIVDGTPVLAKEIKGLDGAGTVGQAIETAAPTIDTDYDYNLAYSYSDIRCTTPLNYEQNVAEACGNGTSIYVYYNRDTTAPAGIYTVNVYTVSEGQPTLLASSDNVDAGLTISAALDLVIPSGYVYDIANAYDSVALTARVNGSTVLRNTLSANNTYNVYLDASTISTTFDGTIIPVNYINGLVRTAYVPALTDVTIIENTVSSITVPTDVTVDAIYLPKTFEGLEGVEQVVYSKAAINSLGTNGVIFAAGTKISGDFSGTSIKYFVAEGTVEKAASNLSSFFNGCSNLVGVQGVEHLIGTTVELDNTFANCTALKYVTIDNTVTSNTQNLRMSRTFTNCPELVEVIIKGYRLGEIDSAFFNSGYSRATATEASPLQRIAFLNCDFTSFVSNKAFADAYCKFDFTGSTNIQRGNFESLFELSNNQATDAELANETTLSFVGWADTITSTNNWFKGARIAKADFSQLRGLANTIKSESAFESARFTSAVAQSYNRALSSDVAVQLNNLYHNAEFILNGTLEETSEEFQNKLTSTLVTKATTANYVFDTVAARRLGVIDYSKLDLAGLESVAFSTEGDLNVYILPTNKLPIAVETAGNYYALFNDGDFLDSMVKEGEAPITLPAGIKAMYKAPHIVRLTDLSTSEATVYALQPGVTFSSYFDYQLYSDAALTVAFDMETLTSHGGNTSLYIPLPLSIEVDGDTKFAGTEVEFPTPDGTVLVYDDGTRGDLLANGQTLTLTAVDATANSVPYLGGYVGFKNAAVYDLSLSAEIGGESKTVSTVSTPVKITLPLPADYVAGQPITVYNYHNGFDAEPIRCQTVVNGDGTFTIITTQFSPFAILYNEVVDDSTYDFYIRFQDNDDAAEKRPDEVKVTVYVNDVQYSVQKHTVTDEEYQKVTLPVPSMVNGTAPTVKVVTATVSGYTMSTGKTYDSLPLVTYKIVKGGTEEIEYKLVFDDEENISGFRPEELKVVLKSSGGETVEDKVTYLKYTDDKEFAIKINVPADEESWKIDSVEGINKDKYKTDIKDLTATFKYEVEKFEKTVIVKWVGDGDNVDKTRPSSIKIRLYSGSSVFDTTEDLKAESWKAIIKCPRYVGGQEAAYTLSTPDLEDYSKSIVGDIITFTYTGELSEKIKDKEEAKETGVDKDTEKDKDKETEKDKDKETTGKEEGKTEESKEPDYSIENFDWIDYANRYPDVFKAFGYDKELLYHHYIYNGMREGRYASFTGKYNSISQEVLEKYTPTSASDSKTDNTIDPNGNTMKEEVESMGTISKVETNEDGTSTVVTTNPDGTKTETKYDKEGNVISTQTYKTGDNRAASAIMWLGCGAAVLAILGFVVFGVNSTSIENLVSGKKSSKSEE